MGGCGDEKTGLLKLTDYLVKKTYIKGTGKKPGPFTDRGAILRK